jgi:hypothetical protein
VPGTETHSRQFRLVENHPFPLAGAAVEALYIYEGLVRANKTINVRVTPQKTPFFKTINVNTQNLQLYLLRAFKNRNNDVQSS